MKSRGYLLATASGIAAAAATGSAHSADMGMPAKAPLPAPVAAPSWSGWYIGGNIGTAWQHAEAINGYGNGPGSASQASFIGGGQIGYNWQHGNFLYGVEADFSGLTHGPRVQQTATAGKGNSISSDIKWLATFRTRTGLAVGDTLVYATGGLAVGRVNNFYAPNGTGAGCSPTSCAVKSEGKTRAGWTVGGGIEHMWTPNWTVGFDALFVDLGHSTAHDSINPTKTSRFSNQAIISRFKVNYKF